MSCTNRRTGVEDALNLLFDLNFDSLTTHWEPDGRVWVAFTDYHDALHFRLAAEASVEVIGLNDDQVEAVVVVSPDLRDFLADWTEETPLRGKVLWFERVQITFANATEQRAFEAALTKLKCSIADE